MTTSPVFCSIDFIAPGGGLTVWCPPGGGLEGDEIPSEALPRELDEEIGLRDYGAATHVWHEEIRDPTVLPGWDGAINDYFLVPVEAAFEPCGSLGREALAAEFVEHFEWWSVDRLLSHEGREVFGPRDLPDRFARLVKDGPPSSPERFVRSL